MRASLSVGAIGVLRMALFLSLTGISSCVLSPPPFEESAWRDQVDRAGRDALHAPHYRDGKFFNPWMPMERAGLWRLVRWKLSRSRAYTEEERTFLPKVRPYLKERILSMPRQDWIAWIGHGTFLMRLDGRYWLTDPMFSERALLPRRVTAPALTARELGEITDEVSVLLSHNHYDHLDVKSIRALPEQTRFYVPLGLKDYVGELHGGPVRELDWWETVDLPGGARLICLPAQHWSRRIGQGLDTSLWASYLLITSEQVISFGGDSGYFVGYKEIGEKFPGITCALLPTTAYHPRWFMHYAHMNSPEVLDAFQDLGAEYLVPTQWGTFHLGDEPPGYPALDLMKTLHERKMDPSRLLIMDIGQIVPLTGKRTAVR